MVAVLLVLILGSTTTRAGKVAPECKGKPVNALCDPDWEEGSSGKVDGMIINNYYYYINFKLPSLLVWST